MSMSVNSGCDMDSRVKSQLFHLFGFAIIISYNVWQAHGWHENITRPDLLSFQWVWILSQNNEAQKVKRSTKMK